MSKCKGRQGRRDAAKPSTGLSALEHNLGLAASASSEKAVSKEVNSGTVLLAEGRAAATGGQCLAQAGARQDSGPLSTLVSGRARSQRSAWPDRTQLRAEPVPVATIRGASGDLFGATSAGAKPLPAPAPHPGRPCSPGTHTQDSESGLACRRCRAPAVQRVSHCAGLACGTCVQVGRRAGPRRQDQDQGLSAGEERGVRGHGSPGSEAHRGKDGGVVNLGRLCPDCAGSLRAATVLSAKRADWRLLACSRSSGSASSCVRFEHDIGRSVMKDQGLQGVVDGMQRAAVPVLGLGLDKACEFMGTEAAWRSS